MDGTEHSVIMEPPSHTKHSSISPTPVKPAATSFTEIAPQISLLLHDALSSLGTRFHRGVVIQKWEVLVYFFSQRVMNLLELSAPEGRGSWIIGDNIHIRQYRALRN